VVREFVLDAQVVGGFAGVLLALKLAAVLRVCEFGADDEII
jgi:hypothetical protein